MAATLRLLTEPSSMGRVAQRFACDVWDDRKQQSCAWTSAAVEQRHAHCGKRTAVFNTLNRAKLTSGPGSTGCNRTVAEHSASRFISADWACRPPPLMSARNGLAAASTPSPGRLPGFRPGAIFKKSQKNFASSILWPRLRLWASPLRATAAKQPWSVGTID